MLAVAVALLLTRIGGVHLHLCFDGNEPPASVHLQDSGVHHADTGLSAAHEDMDVAAAGDLLSKFKVSALGLLLAALLFWPLLAAARKLAVGYSPVASVLSPHFLRPPLRGPPQLLSL